ncbi:periplasmic heavy metal sensor [Thioclava sp. FR2]|uniref:periplasmic heavy metal sensor n=1 Tax=Thioclava sp. FR2 TaxID=3445780 RepID=UPI003EBAA5B5
MSDQQTPPPADTAPVSARRAPTWMKLLLAASLAINLGIVGVVTGAALKFHRGGDMVSGPRDVSFGPYTEALTREQRKGLFKDLSGRDAGLRDLRREIEADMSLVLDSLRASPFDAGAFRAALENQSSRLTARVAEGRKGLVDVVTMMSDAERAEFASKLERRLKEKRRRD